MERRPRVFIGSSSEGKEIAAEFQVALDKSCEAEVWDQGTFGLSQGTLESLVKALASFDFAILAVTADDLREQRGEVKEIPRDNVVFEAGLFMGSLGRERTFLVYDRTKDIGLPSDLAGISMASYAMHSTGNIRASIAAAATQILAAIKKAGTREVDLHRKIDAKIDAVQQTVSASGEIGPDEQIYYEKLSQVIDAVTPSSVTLFYADIDGLRSVTRKVFLEEREKRNILGRALGRRPEAEIREDFLLALSIALTDAVYESRPRGLKHDIFRLPDPDVVLVARELSYDEARTVAARAQTAFHEELVRLWPAADQEHSGLTLLVGNLARVEQIYQNNHIPQLHQWLRKRLNALKDEAGRGKVYGHDDLARPNPGA